MSIKWTGSVSDSGILRKSEFKEKKEELFVFGYSCKLFRDDEKALHIDQGKHLIPWMGDETLKIDRYDARGALHDVASLEAPPGGFDWRVELTRNERDVEQLCDEERYRALHTDEDEEEMYKEEELKRLHAAGYGQVGFNYDTPAEAPAPTTPGEVDEPFAPTPSFKALFAPDLLLPDSTKQNTIIEKTANFIAFQGAQMEILIKAKQGDNPQFRFLDMGAPLRPYYLALVALIKAGKWPEKEPEIVEEKQPETDDYLHPSLAATVIESAPSIPSIHYRPSADCDYSMLVSKMRGEASLDDHYAPELAPGEVAPPGTEPLPPRARPVISRAPVMYTKEHGNYQYTADCDYSMLVSKMRGGASLDDHYAPELAPGEVAPPGTEPLPPRARPVISRAPVMYTKEHSNYQYTADCDYSMLVSKMRGGASLDDHYAPELAPGEVAPPGTEPLPPRARPVISRAPVMYTKEHGNYQYTADCDYSMLVSKMRGGASLDDHYAPELAPGEVAPPGTEPLPPRARPVISRAPVMYTKEHGNYQYTADCDYSMLVSKMRGEASLDDHYATELAPGEVAPPGTEPLPPRARPVISRAPVMYTKEHGNYQYTADCDYSMLVSKMRGEASLDDHYAPELAPGEVAPPGTEPLPPRARPVISRAPVMYTKEHGNYQYTADCDYSMLVSKMRGEASLDDHYAPELAPGEVAPPGTEPLPPRARPVISRAPVMYTKEHGNYQYTADCDYSMLVSKMRGEASLDDHYATELAPGEVAPPGTEPLPPRARPVISRAPVMYTKEHGNYQYTADCDYSMLVSKMRGEASLDDHYAPELAPGEVAPPGTEPLPPRARPVISRAPVMYTKEHGNYQYTADCDYSMLVSKMRGEASLDDHYAPELAPGEVAPPGTEPLPPRARPVISRAPVMYTKEHSNYQYTADCDYSMLVSKMRGEASLDDHYAPELAPGEVAPPGTEPLPPRARPVISRAPVMYTKEHESPPPTPPATTSASAAPLPTRPLGTKSTGLSLMKNYNTDSDSDASDYDSSSSDSKDKPLLITPPEEVKVVIDKMAAYVARNGDEFADIVRAKNDPRFTFLEPDNLYHAYYRNLMQQKRGGDTNGTGKEEPKRTTAPVSFSIKKLKEPDPILPKPALPYESSSEDESEKEKPQSPQPQTPPISQIPQAVVYKMEAQHPTAKAETVKVVTVNNRKEDVRQPVLVQPERIIPKPEIPELRKEKSLTPEKKIEKPRDKVKETPTKRDKPKHRKRPKSESREKKTDRSVEKEKKREKETAKKNEVDEVISLEDNDDELIDLTGDYSDSKLEVESEAEREKQRLRKARAAEFLRKVGVDPAAAMPASSLASAMVDTLESIRKKKAEEEEKRRRRERRRHRSKYDYDAAEKGHRKRRRKNRSSEENDESDIDSSKKKKRKKERKSKNKKKKKQEVEEEEEVHELPPNIDLTNTLKVLRTTSPTKEICQGLEEIQPQRPPSSSDEEETYTKRKKDGLSSSDGERERYRRKNKERESSSEEEGKDCKKRKESGEEKERGKKRRKEDREYSEGEWSSDSEDDSVSSISRDD